MFLGNISDGPHSIIGPMPRPEHGKAMGMAMISGMARVKWLTLAQALNNASSDVDLTPVQPNRVTHYLLCLRYFVISLRTV
jgi:hypothetical protein